MSSNAAASLAKSARVAMVKADPLHEVFKVLQMGSSASTAEMLVAALPLAMKMNDGAEQRHDFQERVLDAVAKEICAAVRSQKEALEALEQEAADLEEEKAQSAVLEADIAVRLAEKKEECDTAHEAMKSKEGPLDEAQVASEAAKRSAEAADGERVGLEKNRDDFAAGLVDLWQPLKASEFQGNRWRERDSKLAQLVKKFQCIGLEESLLAAIKTALKIKGDVRGEFALAAVTCAEEAYMKHIEVLRERVDAFGSEICSRATAVAEAEASAKAAQEALDNAVQANIDAQNVWGDETNVQTMHEAKMKAYEPAFEKLQWKLADARAEFAHLEQVSGSFESQRSIRLPGVEEVGTAEPAAAAGPVAEAAMEMEAPP